MVVCRRTRLRSTSNSSRNIWVPEPSRSWSPLLFAWGLSNRSFANSPARRAGSPPPPASVTTHSHRVRWATGSRNRTDIIRPGCTISSRHVTVANDRSEANRNRRCRCGSAGSPVASAATRTAPGRGHRLGRRAMEGWLRAPDRLGPPHPSRPWKGHPTRRWRSNGNCRATSRSASGSLARSDRGPSR